MTLGEQIQSLRKTAGLSQEELGDKLGVARQSVSKWESDTTVPELDKLIAMSRLFGVSMGALLNLEEPEDTTEELTQRELTAVEEIAKRLIPPSQPAPPKRWGGRMAAGAAAAAVVIAGLLFVGRISRMQTQLDQLRGRVAGINSDISGQISSLAGQVRSILEEQDQPLARSDYQIIEMDLAGGTVTFQLSATPKEYHEGMTAVFSAAGTEFKTVSVPGEEEGGHTFSARLTCPLKDGISLSVGFNDGQTTLTRLLGQEWSLESDTQVEVVGHLNWSASGGPDGPRRLTALSLRASYVSPPGYKDVSGYQNVTITEATFRLWKGDSLIWSAPWEDVDKSQLASVEMEIPADGITLEDGEKLLLSLLYTDSGGRTQEVELNGGDFKDDSAVSQAAPRQNGPYPWEK